MPNHVTNRLQFSGSKKEIKKLVEAIKGDKGSRISFKKIIPQPANIFNGNLGQAEEEMCKREGRPTWYSWNIANWGTKWDAYGTPNNMDTEDTIYFDTAWAAPGVVIKELSEMFPEVEIRHDYADEDAGYNTGSIVYKAGEIIEGGPNEGGTVESWNTYFELNPGSEDEYELVDGSYRYKGEDELD